MRNLALLSIVAGTLIFAQEVTVDKNIKLKPADPEKVAEYMVVDFCINGLLYRGFEALGSYMTSKIVLDPASFKQVIGTDGKPMTCRVKKN